MFLQKLMVFDCGLWCHELYTVINVLVASPPSRLYTVYKIILDAEKYGTIVAEF